MPALAMLVALSVAGPPVQQPVQRPTQRPTQRPRVQARPAAPARPRTTPRPRTQAPSVQRPGASAPAGNPDYAAARSQLESASLAASKAAAPLTAKALAQAIASVEGYVAELSEDAAGREALAIARFNLARTYLRLGLDLRAEAVLDETVRRSPSPRQTQALLGLARAEFGPDLAETLDARVAALDAEPRAALRIECGAPCSASVDGFPVPTGTLWVYPGSHVVHVVGEDARTPSVTEVVEAQPGAATSAAQVRFAVAPPPVLASERTGPPTGPPIPPSLTRGPMVRRKVEIGGVVVASLTAVVGVVIVASTNCDRYPTGCATGQPIGGSLIAAGLGSLAIWVPIFAVDEGRRRRGSEASPRAQLELGQLRF